MDQQYYVSFHYIPSLQAKVTDEIFGFLVCSRKVFRFRPTPKATTATLCQMINASVTTRTNSVRSTAMSR